MADPNNAAARLFAIIADAQSRPIDTSNREVWSGVLGVAANDTATLYRRLATLSELPNEAAAAIATLPDEPDDERFRWKPSVERMLHGVMSNIDSQWRGPIATLDPVSMHSLDYWAKKLAIVRAEPLLDDDEVKELHRLVRELIEQILASGLEPDVKDFLLDQLRAADAALQEYRIRGAQGVVDALQRMAGRTWGQESVARKAADTEEGRSVFGLLGRIARSCADVVRVADFVMKLYGPNVPALPAPPIQHLLSGPQIVDVQSVDAERTGETPDSCREDNGNRSP